MRAAFLALALLPAMTQADPTPASIQVLQHACDAGGNVTALLVKADGPATIVIRWSNEAVCGTKT